MITSGTLMLASAGILQLAGTASSASQPRVIAAVTAKVQPDQARLLADIKTTASRAYVRKENHRIWRYQEEVRKAKLLARQRAEQKAQAAQVTAQSAVQTSPASGGQYPVGTEGGPISTAGMPAFEACVISRESTGYPHVRNPSSASGLFGIENPLWTGVPGNAWFSITAKYPDGAYSASAGVQEKVFGLIYAAKGTAPWAPYDGC